MGGYSLTLLVLAEDEQEAFSVASGEIDTLFERHDLVEGDKGYVDKDEPVIPATDTEKFCDAIKKMLKIRQNTYRHHIQAATKEASEAGFALDEFPIEEKFENRTTLVGYHLHHAGEIQARYFCPWCVLYDTENYEAGMTEERLIEILEDPTGYYLVDVTVG
jgi:hypothetical protein